MAFFAGGALHGMFIYLFSNLCVLDLVWEGLCVQDSWVEDQRCEAHVFRSIVVEPHLLNGFELDQTTHPMPRAVALVSKHCGEARVGAQACLSI